MTTHTLPDELFHYTSAGGALGILKKGSVWASMLHYMNDGSEFAYALDLARELIAQALGTGEDDAWCRTLCERYLETITNLAVFTFSLSEEKDLLSQWRAYCPPEGGYAIGFRAAELEQAVRAEGFQLVPCEYDHGRQLTLLRPVVSRMVETARALGEGASGMDLHKEITDDFAAVAASLKHPSFGQECEWRLVGAHKEFSTASYRATKTLIVPYFDLQVASPKSFPISRVVVGPHRYPGLARRSLHFMTAVVRGWPVQVEHSKTPYRVIG